MTLVTPCVGIHHALHHYLPEQSTGGIPPVLADCGEMLTVIKLALEGGRSAAGDPVLRALTDVAVRLAARGVSAGGVMDERRDAIREVRRQEAEQRRDAAAEEELAALEVSRPQAQLTLSVLARSSLPRIVVGVGMIMILALASTTAYLKVTAESVPAAATYRDVPAVAIIRHRDEIVVRVPPTWLRQPKATREAALRSLYARFAAELKDGALPVLIVGLKDEPYGGVAGERVWWDVTPEPKATLEPAPDTPKTD